MNTLKAEKRSMNVKAKKLRREGYVTGNVFGKEIEGSIPIQMKNTDVNKLLKTANKGSKVTLEIDEKPLNALIKEIDFNTNTGYIDEIDFQALVSNELVHSVAEIIPLNHESVQEGIFQLELQEVSYKALPAALIDKVKIDVSSMKVGDVILVKDLEIASNKDIMLMTDPETIVATVTVVHGGAVEESEEAEE